MSVVFLFFLVSPVLFSAHLVQSENSTTSVPGTVPLKATAIPKPKPSENITNSREEIVYEAGFLYMKSNPVLGEKCSSNADCKPKDSFCINETCQCRNDYVPSSKNRSCLKKANRLLDPCSEDIQCEAGLNTTDVVACISYQCFCAIDAHVVAGKCYKKKALGNICSKDEECFIAFSSCIQGVCACDDNMQPSEDDNECITMKAIDAVTNCTDDHMCRRFGEYYRCDNGNCTCKLGYHFDGAKCAPEKRLGDPCDRPLECAVSSEEVSRRSCRNNTCTCIGGFKEDRNMNLCKSGAPSVMYNMLPLGIIFLYCLMKNL